MVNHSSDIKITNDEELMVSIQCCTYNHELYIRQCLEGFVMQKTNFKFEAIVHDDASTDKTADIIREYAEKYPDIIKPIFETENQYSKGDGSLDKIMIAQMRGKYIALCEGDDYWIDPLKLQKQVDYLNSHTHCSLLHTSFNFYFQEEQRYVNSQKDNDIALNAISTKQNIACEIIDFNYRVATATTMFPSNLYFNIINDPYFNAHHFWLGDIQLWSMLLQYGDIGFLRDTTTVYRIHEGSACRHHDEKLAARASLSRSEMQMYFLPRIKNGEYLKKKFEKDFIKQLFKYNLYYPEYVSFITVVKSPFWKCMFYYLTFPIFRKVISYCLKIKRKVMKNSPTLISSAK